MCAVAVLAGACTAEPVAIPDPGLHPDAERACAALVDDLPPALGELERGVVRPSDAPGAAWGDPPVVLTCGGDVPASFSRTAFCQEVNGVGWYVPDAALDDESLDVTLVTVGRRPIVTVVVPSELRPEMVATASARLAAAVAEYTDEVRPCL
ncbi:DUF3515 domain-containing protein [Nocardioides coralli]|uniref:DUF3515 domain-containing protein n=1 Tax=Nocardioides coralli TaxID=2872154 RepID=UPI001CA4492D|nr:DUF3515 domain-containing protein [Nocardioides coralli]QZY28175.1 DUF3515 domain-containing protein [Nocardioides coralli]